MNGSSAVEPPNLTVPDDLAELDRWVLWRYEARDGSKTKIPYSISGTRAITTDPRTWSTFDAALARWRRYPSGYAGLGFVFDKRDGLAGIDLDRCLETGNQVKDWAQNIIHDFSDTYMEISPSGVGITICARGELPGTEGVKFTDKDGGIELYSTARFFTVTGNVFRGAPLEVADHTNELRILYRAITGKRAGEGASKGWVLPQRIRSGRRNHVLTSVAGSLATRNVCLSAIRACIATMNRDQCEEPIGDAEIDRILRSADKWLQKNQRGSGR